MREYRNPSAETAYRQMLKMPEMFPVRFMYGGIMYYGFSRKDFTVSGCEIKNLKDRETGEITLLGPENLTVVIKTALYPEFGVYEWTVYFENRGDAETALLSDVWSLDAEFSGERPVLKGILGDHVNRYRPYEKDLAAETVRFVSDSGRATHVSFPYFNLEHGDGGTMFAIGWAGTWTAEFSWNGKATRVSAKSVNDLKLTLKPGESIRTALVVVAGYGVRDEDYATNFWRSWFVRCNLPDFSGDGTPMHPFSTTCLAYDTGRPNSDGSISETCDTWLPSMKRMEEIGVHVDFRWFDAGYYPDPWGNTVPTDWWGTVGVWKLDPVKWPGDTFRQSVEYAHARGTRTLMWFEPERVTHVDGLVQNHGYDGGWALRRANTKVITNNLGDPACFDWVTGRICETLQENRIDMYREDNNGDPGPLWRELDARSGRFGLTECLMIDAHYRMWDLFIETTSGYGGCAFVDSCASGGGRNDLESLRRGVPLLRSDADRTSAALRLSMTTSFNRWVPMNGANTREKLHELDAKGRMDVYTWRASYLPALNVDAQYVYEPEENLPMLRFGLEEWQRIKRYLLKDFHVLTPWHDETDTTGFTAFAYFDEEAEEGILLAFRMENCEEDALTLRLPFAEGRGLVLTDADDGGVSAADGGVSLRFSGKRTAKLLYIRKN